MSRKPRVLVVEDDEEARAEIARALPRDRYAWEMATSVDLGQGGAARAAFDLVIAGVPVDGLVVLDRIRREWPGVPVILVSTTGRTRDAVDAIKRGAFYYLGRPLDDAELRAAVDEAVTTGPTSSMAASGERERDCFEGRPAPPPVPAGVGLVGSGPAMSRLREAIRLVASSSAPALIVGESGVGKELVACAIHAESPRRGQAFIGMNASAIPANLLEAELFGHVRGGFTGATRGRKGLLTEASGGTLLLDEIGDMPLDLQAKILRVLQLGEVRPVGSDRAHRVDVRVIAATHRDLPRMVREGQFREDLYFRLHVLPVTVPPLRERREDIPALVAYHLALARSRSPGSPVRSIAPGALEILVTAPWPGNVRQLASVVERLVVFGREEAVEAPHVAFVHEGSNRPVSTLPLPDAPSDAPWTLRRVLDAYTEQVLQQTGGNKQRAAEILDVDLSTLYRWQRARRDPADGEIDLAESRKGALSRTRRPRDGHAVVPTKAHPLGGMGDAEPEVHH
jgi:two-component system, NtrC family, response regulator HydG